MRKTIDGYFRICFDLTETENRYVVRIDIKPGQHWKTFLTLSGRYEVHGLMNQLILTLLTGSFGRNDSDKKDCD